MQRIECRAPRSGVEKFRHHRWKRRSLPHREGRCEWGGPSMLHG